MGNLGVKLMESISLSGQKYFVEKKKEQEQDTALFMCSSDSVLMYVLEEAVLWFNLLRNTEFWNQIIMKLMLIKL